MSYTIDSAGTGNTWTHVETGTTGERYHQRIYINNSPSPVKPQCKGRVTRPRNRLSICSQGTRRPESPMRLGTCRNLGIPPSHHRISVDTDFLRSRSPMRLLRNAFERWQRRHRRA